MDPTHDREHGDRRGFQVVRRLYLVIPEVLTVGDPEALAEAVLTAVESAGVGRVVFQSSLGADKRSGAEFISALGRI